MHFRQEETILAAFLWFLGRDESEIDNTIVRVQPWNNLADLLYRSVTQNNPWTLILGICSTWIFKLFLPFLCAISIRPSVQFQSEVEIMCCVTYYCSLQWLYCINAFRSIVESYCGSAHTWISHCCCSHFSELNWICHFNSSSFELRWRTWWTIEICV